MRDIFARLPKCFLRSLLVCGCVLCGLFFLLFLDLLDELGELRVGVLG